MKNREFYSEKIMSTLGTHGICKVMSDLVFPFYREKYGTAVACDEDCATCTAMFTMWLGEKAKYQAVNPAPEQPMATHDMPKAPSLLKDKSLDYDYIDDLGRPIKNIDGDLCNALTGEVYNADLNETDRTPEWTVEDDEYCEDAKTVNFHKGAFETGTVGIYCDTYEDVVSLCHILKNMGYKGVDLDQPEQYKQGGFYIYNKHDKTVFLFDASFVPYFEGTTSKRVDEEFCILNYSKIDFLPNEQEKPEDVHFNVNTVEIDINDIIKAITTPFVSVALP